MAGSFMRKGKGGSPQDGGDGAGVVKGMPARTPERGLGLGIKIIAASVLVLVLVVAVNYAVFLSGYKADAQRAMIDRAAAFTAVADEAKSDAARKLLDGQVNHDELLAEALERHDREPEDVEPAAGKPHPVVAIGALMGALT